MSRTFVGEEQKKLSAQAVSLLVLREVPNLLARTVLSDKGNSFQLTSLPIQLASVTQYVDSQVGIRNTELQGKEPQYKYNAAINVEERHMLKTNLRIGFLARKVLPVLECPLTGSFVLSIAYSHIDVGEVQIKSTIA